jgi:hypothetical protein
MDKGKYLRSIEEIKAMDMVDYLSGLGYEPAKVRDVNYWYQSPLREEKDPSFKVNRKLNLWYDHGLGKGGNIIDFGILYYTCTVAEFLKQVNGLTSFQKHYQPLLKPESAEATENKITILQEGNLAALPLLRYLSYRHIPLDLARQFCKEIVYSLNGKTYYGIGFKNDSGGYEIRNPYFKASSSPKDITTMQNGSSDACVFEGFTDFLSFMVAHKNQLPRSTNFVVLNSVSLFEKARPFMEQHDAIRLYLDRDQAGQKLTQYALSLSDKYKDESHLYANHKDYNDWLVYTGKVQKRDQRLKLS